MDLRCFHLNQSPVQVKKARLFFAGFGQSAAFYEPFFKDMMSTTKQEEYDIFFASNYGNMNEQAQVLVGDTTYENVLKTDENAYKAYLLEVIQSEALELKNVFSKYDELEVIAWSFGVCVAPVLLKKMNELLSKEGLKAPQIIAYTNYAGTLEAVDLKYGIAPAAYELTLNALNDTVLNEFLGNTLKSLPIKLRPSFKKELNEVNPNLCESLERIRDKDVSSAELDTLNTTAKLISAINRRLNAYINELSLMVNYPKAYIDKEAADSENRSLELLKSLFPEVKPSYIVNAFDSIMHFDSQLRSALSKVGSFKEQKSEQVFCFEKGTVVLNAAVHLDVAQITKLLVFGAADFINDLEKCK